MRTFIVGGSLTGKTMFARRLSVGGRVLTIHTDDYLHHDHADIPDKVREDVLKHDNVVVEGTQVARLLRRYPELAEGARVYVHRHHGKYDNPKHVAQEKGVHTVWKQARRKLKGATILPQR